MTATQTWVYAMKHLWSLEKAARMNELRGKYVRSFDGAGINPQSMFWGKVWLAEELAPHLQQFGSHPTELRAAAKAAAEGAFRNEIILGAVIVGEVEAPA